MSNKKVTLFMDDSPSIFSKSGRFENFENVQFFSTGRTPGTLVQIQFKMKRSNSLFSPLKNGEKSLS
jgi:hypothetical protein